MVKLSVATLIMVKLNEAKWNYARLNMAKLS